jgi:tetratricopeptide (TPR) repeat protein
MSPRKQCTLSKRRPLVLLLPVVLVALAATVIWRPWQHASSSKPWLEQARQALASKRYTSAEELCQRILSDDPHSAEALLLAGQAAAEQDRLADALEYYDKVPAEAGDLAVSARDAAGDGWLQIGHASKAEVKYREALEINPRDTHAHERLAILLTVLDRRFESLPHVYELLRQGRATYDILMLAGEHAHAVEYPDELARLRAAAPDDPGPLVGLAGMEVHRRNYGAAAGLLRQALAAAPEYIEAHALLGRILLEESDDEGLEQWAAALPAEADAHPDVWAARGGWAKRRGQREAAARCFWEALRRDPNHIPATLQLSQSLEALRQDAPAKRVAERGALLSAFSATLSELRQHRDDAEMLFRAARDAETLGRLWEAWSWNQGAMSILGNATWAREGLKRIKPQLHNDLPPTLPQVDLGIQLDLSRYPLPLDGRQEGADALVQALPSAARARFEDVAGPAGITFNYFCGREVGEPRVRMYEQYGGGIAVLDYDLDGWPDLYFTQGCRWPPKAGQTEFLDAIYRNRGDGRFDDVTPFTGLGDDRFSQGATVGDFNNDGFPDLYVANIGVNRLYVNNGDGTFDDVSTAAGISADRWTSSCLLADLNSDGLPDLYDVNYVQGEGVFERSEVVNGMPRVLGPLSFQPTPDDFHLNLGDGRFEEMSESAGVRVARGNGLGIVAADFEGGGRLSLFVANDADGNFYFVNRAPAAGSQPRFEERGLLAGLAYNRDGRPTASMGVAAGDANGDGRLDLFVTNFSGQSSTLYLQVDDESFVDATGPDLSQPSLAMLGFGTQFIDGELDGLADLVVSNGHVWEFSAPGVPYAMRPQYFRNVGGGRFKELSASSLGAYFQQTYFGRSLVRLDWNRDGREDFAVSSLEAPAALLTNRTDNAGHYLAVQLRGVQSSRDAIGAVVTVHVGDRRQRQWLTAGDGFQASNQRQLVFGLGESRRVDALTINWPSGISQEFRGLAADQELIFVESSPHVTALRR